MDADGNLRGSWGAFGDESCFNLYDNRGLPFPGITLEAGIEGGESYRRIVLYREGYDDDVKIGVEPDGESVIELGRPLPGGVRLTTKPDCPSSIGLSSEDGEHYVIMAADADRAIIGLHDDSLRTRAVLFYGDEMTYLVICDESGVGRASLGNTELVTKKTGVIEKHPPSTLVLFDESGKVVFKAPPE